MKIYGQKGFAPILLMVALIGVLAFVSITAVAPFRNSILSSLFPKDSSFAATSDISFESHYNPFGDPWASKLAPNADIPVVLTTGCYRRGPKYTGRETDPTVDQAEIDYLAKSNVAIIFEECAMLQGANSKPESNRQRIINIATKLKQKNPNAKYIGYHVFWDVNFDGNLGSDIWGGAANGQFCGTVKCESLFVHKKGLPATKENRITGARTFDITNPNFRQYIIPKVVQAMNEMNIDGFLADGVAPTIPGINMAEVPDTIAANWGAGWADLLRDTKTAMGPNKLLFINSGGVGVSFTQSLLSNEAGTGKPRADGAMWEDPLGNLALDMNSSGRLSELNSMLNMATGLNKYLMIVVNTNVNCQNSSGQPVDYCFNQTNKQNETNFAKYYLANFLNIYRNNKTMMVYYTPLKTSPQFDSETFFRDWDLRIGQPISGMEQVSPGVYLRRFQKAYVYWNNSYSNYTGGGAGLYNLDGTPASSHVVPAKRGVIYVTQQVLQEWNVNGSPSPSPTAPVSTAPGQTVATSAVTKLESTAKANYFNYFYTTKQNEIDFLLPRNWRLVSSSFFYTPKAGTVGAEAVRRMYKLDSPNGIQIATWALTTADRDSLKARGFSEYNESDFYAYQTAQQNSIGITRMKYFSSTYNQTLYEFAKNQSEITSLQQKGWSIDAQNVFYAYNVANPVVTPSSSPIPSPVPSPSPATAKPNVVTANTYPYCSGVTPVIHIEWSVVPNTALYKVFRSTAAPGSGIKVGETSGIAMNDSSLVSSTQYIYTIEATFANGTSVTGNSHTIQSAACVAPSPSPIVVNKSNVRKLEHLARTSPPYYEKFYSAKQNEIDFLKARAWTDAGVAFKAPVSGTPDALMAKRMYLIDNAIGAQIRTWAVNTTDVNELLAKGYLQSNDGDFYAYTTQKAGTVGITRMKMFSGTYNKTFLTFAVNQTEINTLTSQGWSVDKSNIFYVYP